MEFIHHHRGEWIRSEFCPSAVRVGGYCHKYKSIESIDNQWLKDNFAWMIEKGFSTITCGSDILEIRG